MLSGRAYVMKPDMVSLLNWMSLSYELWIKPGRLPLKLLPRISS